MSEQLSGPMLPPREGEAQQLVVLLHGYGSDGQDLISLAPYLQDLLPHAAFVAPNAPHACAINPAGFEWFPLDLDREISRLEGIETTRPIIKSFLTQLWEGSGLGPGDTILAGFSQGAMIALDSGLRLDAPLKAILSFSGGIVSPETIGDALQSKPPVCLVHGEIDDVVPPSMSILGEKALKEAGIGVRLHLSPGVGHSISPDGLDFARGFVGAMMQPA